MPRLQAAFLHTIGWDARYVIAQCTGRPVHAAAIIDGTLYEAAFSGVREIDPAIRMATGDWELVDIPDGIFNVDAARAYARERLGRKYDLWGAIMAWSIAKKVTPNGAKDREFCSEYDAGIFRAAEMPLFHIYNAAYTPRMLRDELVNVRGYRLHRYVAAA
jgi:hypothetical protein